MDESLKCLRCGHEFKMSPDARRDVVERVCPKCKSNSVRRLLLQQHLGCDRLKGGNAVEVLRWIWGYAKQVYQG